MFNGLAKLGESLAPALRRSRFFRMPAQVLAHLTGDGDGAVARGGRTDKLETVRARRFQMLTQPILPPGHGVDGVEQGGAGAARGFAAERSEVCQAKLFMRRFVEKEVTQGRIGGSGKFLKLPERWLAVAVLPMVKLVKGFAQGIAT